MYRLQRLVFRMKSTTIKKNMTLLISCVTVLVFLPLAAEPGIVASGVEGNSISWTFWDDGTLELSGSGGTLDYNKEGAAPTIQDRPWNLYKARITKLVVNEGISRIGSRAFQSYKSLEQVDLPSSMTSIGVWAFQNCDNLSAVDIPIGMAIGTGAFRGTPAELDIAAQESQAYKESIYYERLVETEISGDYRNDVIAIARSQIGYHEGDSEADYGGSNTNGSHDYTEYGRYFGSAGNAWCSEFASWCIRMAGVPNIIVNSSSGANATTFTSNSHATYHQWDETVWGSGSYMPRKGDVILWVWKSFTGNVSANSSLSHTTLIEDLSTSDGEIRFSVVHGNSGGKVGTKVYVVNPSNGHLSDGSGYVGYFVAPDYESNEVQKCIVEFDATGGEIGISQKTAAIGGLYGPLPVPCRSDRVFVGWQTKAGRSINMYSPCRLADSQEQSGSPNRGGSTIIMLEAKWSEILPNRMFPELDETATPEDVTNAINSVHLADATGVLDAIGGSASEYATFRTWAKNVAGGDAAVVASSYAGVSYLLGAKILFQNTPRILFTDMSPNMNETASVFVKIKVYDGNDTAEVSEDRIAQMFEATNNIGDWTGANRLDLTVNTYKAETDGSISFTITPSNVRGTCVFLRISLK